MTDRLIEYLQAEGSLELISEVLMADKARFTELDKELSISHETLSKRLGEGVEIGIFKKEAARSGRGNPYNYRLNYIGTDIALVLGELGFHDSYREYKKKRDKYVRKSEQFEEFLTEYVDEPIEDDGSLNLPIHAYLDEEN